MSATHVLAKLNSSNTPLANKNLSKEEQKIQDDLQAAEYQRKKQEEKEQRAAETKKNRDQFLKKAAEDQANREQEKKKLQEAKKIQTALENQRKKQEERKQIEVKFHAEMELEIKKLAAIKAEGRGPDYRIKTVGEVTIPRERKDLRQLIGWLYHQVGRGKRCMIVANSDGKPKQIRFSVWLVGGMMYDLANNQFDNQDADLVTGFSFEELQPFIQHIIKGPYYLELATELNKSKAKENQSLYSKLIHRETRAFYILKHNPEILTKGLGADAFSRDQLRKSLYGRPGIGENGKTVIRFYDPLDLALGCAKRNILLVIDEEKLANDFIYLLRIIIDIADYRAENKGDELSSLSAYSRCYYENKIMQLLQTEKMQSFLKDLPSNPNLKHIEAFIREKIFGTHNTVGKVELLKKLGLYEIVQNILKVVQSSSVKTVSLIAATGMLRDRKEMPQTALTSSSSTSSSAVAASPANVKKR